MCALPKEIAVPHTLLISPTELAAQLDAPNCFIFDVRHELQDVDAGRTAYRAGHIPGAIFLHMDEDLSGQKTGQNGRHPLPEREAFAAKLAGLGVTAGAQVVAYDAAGGMMAGYLYHVHPSAPLAVGKSFGHYCGELGLDALDPPPETGMWGSPFDYEKNALLYAPEYQVG